MCTTFCLVSQFREGRTSVCDRIRTEWPAKTVTANVVANVESLVNKNCRVTLDDVANKFSINMASEHRHICMSKVSTRWLPRQLSADHKANKSDQCNRKFNSF